MNKSKISNKSKLQILIVLAVAVTLSLGFYMYEETEVTLHVDKDVEEVVSKASTVEEFLEEQEITLDEDGYINVSMEKELEDNMDIMIKTPKTYTISVAGDERDVKSTYTTVEEILSDSGVDIVEANGDYAIPDLRSEVGPGHKLSVFHVKEVEEITEEKIPFENIVRKNSKLEEGTTKVIQEGREGIKEIKTKLRYVNDELSTEEVLEENITLEEMNNIVENGTKKKVVAPTRSAIAPKAAAKEVAVAKADAPKAAAPEVAVAKADAPKAAKEAPAPKADAKEAPAPKAAAKESPAPAKSQGSAKTMQATGYSTRQAGLSRYTANGTDLHKNPRVIAVDPNVIPLGTRVEVEGYGTYVAADTGGDIKGNRIDIHFTTVQQCLDFGRRDVKVTILN